jgi:hypothetical protein
MCLEDGPCDARDRWRRKVDGLGLGLRHKVSRGFSPSFLLLSIRILSRTCFVFCSGVCSPLVTCVGVGLSAPWYSPDSPINLILLDFSLTDASFVDLRPSFAHGSSFKMFRPVFTHELSLRCSGLSFLMS